jgi:hypothetical protein
MRLRCKCCNTLIGVSYPYTDWSVERDSLCPACAEREHLGEVATDEAVSSEAPTKEFKIPTVPKA